MLAGEPVLIHRRLAMERWVDILAPAVVGAAVTVVALGWVGPWLNNSLGWHPALLAVPAIILGSYLWHRLQ